MKDEKITFKLEPSHYDPAIESDPVIQFIPNGKRTYLWIGGKRVFGTLAGPKTLEKFARQLLAALKPKKKAARR